MSRSLLLFSSSLERDAAFPEGIPDHLSTAISGVGLVDAGIGTREAIARHRPDHLLFLGTCGAYPESGLEIGEVISATHVLLGSGDTFRGEMRVPQLLPSALTCSSEGFGDLKKGRVVCTMGVTENDELASVLGEQGEVENLELFSVVRAAGSIPVSGILGVTNRVGVDGGKDWRRNFREVMRSLVGLVESL